MTVENSAFLLTNLNIQIKFGEKNDVYLSEFLCTLLEMVFYLFSIVYRSLNQTNRICLLEITRATETYLQ